MYSKSCYVKGEARSVGSNMLIADLMLTGSINIDHEEQI